MDPSRAFLRTEISQARGRAGRPGRSKRTTRSTSADPEESSSVRRMLKQSRLFRSQGQRHNKSSKRQSRSHTRHSDIANVTHLDVEPECAEETLTSTPDIIWRSKLLNHAAPYRYTPLQSFTDFRLLHVLPASDGVEMVQLGFTRHNSRADRKFFVPFVFVEDVPSFYANRSSLMMLNGLPFYVSSDMETMLKCMRRTETTVLLFNRSICIGENYKVYEASSNRWNAEELEKEVRQLCTLRRLKRPNLPLGIVLTWDVASHQLLQAGQPFDIAALQTHETPVRLAPAYRDYERSEKPATGAQKGTYLRGRWSPWDGEDGQRPWARQLGCRARSTDSRWQASKHAGLLAVLPPSERPVRRSRSEQRDADAIGWRGREVDMDEFWDGLFHTHVPDDFLWRRRLKPQAGFFPFTHGEINYDKEIVLAQILDDDDDTDSIIRCSLLRFRWDRVPEFIFLANSMAFNPYMQATIQINGQFARISLSLEVCLRSFRSLQSARQSTLLFVWPLCIPLHRMIDTSWVNAIFCTVYPKAARVIDVQGHLAGLSAAALERLTKVSYYWNSKGSNRLESMHENSGSENGDRCSHDEPDIVSDEESCTSREEEQQRTTQERSYSTLEDEAEVDTLSTRRSVSSEEYDVEYASNSDALILSRDGRESIPDDDQVIATVAFRDYDHATRTGELAHVRNAHGGIYCPLDPVSQEVRLVAAMPEDSADPSRLQVEIGSRDLAWGFIALSYCWGDADDQQIITVNGNQVSVRRNLYEFLMFLRQEWPVKNTPDSRLTRFTLWIDALSINQKDTKEKAREVRRMDKIYKAADFVFVWLGQAAADIPWDVDELLEDPNENETKLRQVADQLVASPYFFRAWCTQELAVNKQTYLCIGTRMLPWASFVTFTMTAFMPSARALIERMKYSGIGDRYTAWLHESGSAVSRFHIVNWLRYRLRCGKPPTLLSLLAATSHCDCTVRSDQIYSLWSLASDAAALLPDINYLKTGKALFSDFARSWMRRYKRCDILAFVEFSYSSRAFHRTNVADHNPSWAPDWTLRQSAWPLLAPWFSPTLHDEVADQDIESQLLYNADAGVSANVEFVSIGGTPCLIADGIRADRLVRVLDKFLGLPDMLEWYEKCQSWLRDIGEHFEMNPVDHASSSPEGQLIDALVAGRHHDGRYEETSSSKLVLAHMEDGTDDIAVAQFEDDGSAMVERFDTDDNPWVQHVMLITAGRRLAITESGHVGLVPEAAAVGDEVVVIFGCCMPLVFRRGEEGAARTLIGECYFRDLMNGEVLDAARHRDDSAYANISAEKMSSALKERIPDLEKKNGFGEAMEGLSDLFLDPPAEDCPQIQCFCIR